MPSPPNKLTANQFVHLIYEIRGQRVMLDSDLARIYGVPTYRFNEAFKRNRHRFPSDFAFQLTAKEFASLRSQAAAVTPQAVGNERDAANSSQFAMSSTGRRGATYRPWAFTEHGALQAANVGHSRRRALASYPCCHTAYPHGSRSRVFSTAGGLSPEKLRISLSTP